jgi:hypothetical protein
MMILFVTSRRNAIWVIRQTAEEGAASLFQYRFALVWCGCRSCISAIQVLASRRSIVAGKVLLVLHLSLKLGRYIKNGSRSPALNRRQEAARSGCHCCGRTRHGVAELLCDGSGDELTHLHALLRSLSLCPLQDILRQIDGRPHVAKFRFLEG